MKKKIAILDTQLMFGQALAFYMNKMFDNAIAVVLCQDSTQLFSDLRSNNIDIVIMELNVSNCDGLEIISDIKVKYPELKIIVVSAYKQASLVKSAMVAGADAYISKVNDISEIQKAILDITLNKIYLGKNVRLTPCQIDSPKRKNVARDPFILKRTLTRREKEVLSCMVEGYSTKDTSKKLFISNATVLVHKKNIMKKLMVNKTSKMIKLAKSEKLV